jgi:hypothetical protein
VKRDSQDKSNGKTVGQNRNFRISHDRPPQKPIIRHSRTPGKSVTRINGAAAQYGLQGLVLAALLTLRQLPCASTLLNGTPISRGFEVDPFFNSDAATIMTLVARGYDFACRYDFRASAFRAASELN